jgi:hypothetical protein
MFFLPSVRGSSASALGWRYPNRRGAGARADHPREVWAVPILRAVGVVDTVVEGTVHRLEEDDAPTLADFGFFASMFRHFSQDPTPAAIMRERAPGVFEWQARLWNARASNTGDRLEDGVPEDWGPILDRIGSQYLPYLCANAEAWKAGARRPRRRDRERALPRPTTLPRGQPRLGYDDSAVPFRGRKVHYDNARR